jgi:hypothetical protein
MSPSASEGLMFCIKIKQQISVKELRGHYAKEVTYKGGFS